MSFVLIAFLIFPLLHSPFIFAKLDTVYYQIVSDNALLYRSQKLLETDAYFILPPTYFVRLNYEVDDTTIAVCYLDFEGFVKRTDVKKVYSIPQKPYLENVNFEPNSVANLVIRSRPNTQSDYLGVIPFSATDITYYGTILGETVYNELSSEWYYCRYSSPEQGIITGYVYAPLTSDLSPILPNTEVVALEPIQPTNAELTLSPELQSPSNIVLIVLLTIPALFIIYLMLKSNKNKHTKSLRSKFKKANHLTLRAPPDDELDF